MKTMLTGSAPIDANVLDFLKLALGCQIVEGYGQTETTAYAFLSDINDTKSGSLGGVNKYLEFKIVDVPDLNYSHKDKDENGKPSPRGELWMRGHGIIPGYYLLDEENKKTFTPDGWLKTGDIIQLKYPRLDMHLIDRKKNIFKLSQGEYIIPDKLENIYQKSNKLFDDVFVYGNSKKNCLVGVVAVKKQKMGKLMSELGANEENVEKKIVEYLEQVRAKSGLNRLEGLAAVKIETEDWLEKNLITNSLKKKRHDLENYYKKDFDKMYEKLGE